jgi:hypothetical protein
LKIFKAAKLDAADGIKKVPAVNAGQFETYKSFCISPVLMVIFQL